MLQDTHNYWAKLHRITMAVFLFLDLPLKELPQTIEGHIIQPPTHHYQPKSRNLRLSLCQGCCDPVCSGMEPRLTDNWLFVHFLD